MTKLFEKPSRGSTHRKPDPLVEIKGLLASYIVDTTEGIGFREAQDLAFQAVCDVLDTAREEEKKRAPFYRGWEQEK